MADIVVVDVDAGIDDIYGLLLLINAENVGLLTIAAIVCSVGNTILFNSCRNTVRMLEVLNRTDIPLYRGVNRTIIAPHYFDNYFGMDGFGDVEGLWEPDMGMMEEENAAKALRDLTQVYPGRITLISLGPLTFTAIALIQYDDILLKDIWIMGGNSTEFPEPEFNFRNDPEAVYGVLKRIGVPAYILSFDACTALNISVEWRRNTLGAVGNDVMALMNAAEEFMLEPMEDDEFWIFCDPILVGAMIYQQVNSTQSEHCGTVNLSHCEASSDGGFLLLDSNCSDPNVILVENVNSDYYKNVLLEAVSNL